MTYCIVLTTGEDENYSVKQVYLSDHAIDPEEWNVEMQAFSNRVHQAHIEAAHGIEATK